MKKYIYILATAFYENAMRYILFFFSMIIILASGYFVINALVRSLSVYRMFDLTGLVDNIVYYDDISAWYNMNRNDSITLPSLIASADGVKSAEYFSNGGIVLDDGKNIMEVQDYCMLNDQYPFEMVEGRSPDPISHNEVVIPEYLDGYGINDIIRFCNVYDKYTVSLKVVGIYDSDKTLLLCSNRKSAKPTLLNRFFYASRVHSLNNPPILITYNLITDDGTAIQCPEYYAVNITVEEGFDQETVVQNIRNRLIDDNNVISYSEMKDNYRNELSDSIRAISRILVVFSLIFILVVITNTILGFNAQKSVWFSYYISGFPWIKCLLVQLVSYILFALSALFPAYWLLSAWLTKPGYSDYSVDFRYLAAGDVFLIVFIALLYLMLTGIFVKRNPLDGFSKD